MSDLLAKEDDLLVPDGSTVEEGAGSVLQIKDGGVSLAKWASGVLDTDGTLAANSDSTVASQKAVRTYVTAHSSTASVRDQFRLNALGFLAETWPRILGGTTGNFTSQRVEGVLLGFHAGDVVTGVQLVTSLAASGTTPTTARVGIADSTGKILARSNNLNATANWPLGSVQLPFSSAYTILADGGYYLCVLIDGVWGTNNPNPLRQSTTAPVINAAVSGGCVPHFSWSGQTDLPAVNSSLTMTSAATSMWWMAGYGTPA